MEENALNRIVKLTVCTEIQVKKQTENIHEEMDKLYE